MKVANNPSWKYLIWAYVFGVLSLAFVSMLISSSVNWAITLFSSIAATVVLGFLIYKDAMSRGLNKKHALWSLLGVIGVIIYHLLFVEIAFIEAVVLFFSKPKLLLNTLVFDFLFFSCIYGIWYLLQLMLPDNIANVVSASNGMLFFYYFIVLIIYPLSLLITYSFFKYIILNFVKSFEDDSELHFDRFWKFFWLNAVIFLCILFLVFLIFIISNLAFREDALAVILLFVYIILLIFIYPFINICHTMFTLNATNKDSLRMSSKKVFSKFFSYAPIYLFSFAVFIIFTLLYYLITLPFHGIIANNTYVFMTISSFFIYIFIYAVFVFNRLYFYLITKEKLM